MRYWVIAVLLALAAGAYAQAPRPVWSDGFERGTLLEYLNGLAPKGVTLEKLGPDAGVGLRLSAGMKTEVMLKEFAVEPGVKYRLEFGARTDGPDVFGKNPAAEQSLFDVDKSARGLLLPGWEVRVLNAQGQLPFDGHQKSFWQYCFYGDWRTYRQSFYTPVDAARVQILFFNPGGKNTLWIDNVTLEKSTDPSLLVGAGAFSGLFDYTGWNELSKARIIDVNGKFTLRVDTNGYALTDPVPVTPGDYAVTAKKIGASVFFYDAYMRRIGMHRWASPKFTAPEGCAYVQLYFGPGDIEGVTMTRLEVKR